MSHHNGQAHQRGCCWVADLIERAWPETAGVTLAALEALSTQESFTPAQMAYVSKLMLMVGAQARTAGDRAELEASAAARFEPAPTREARIALRVAAMTEQHEIAWLRRYDRPPDVWPGGTADQAEDQLMWDADRPDLPDLGPSAAAWHPRAGVPLRRTRNGTLMWADAYDAA